jgi:hypothetical protein
LLAIRAVTAVGLGNQLCFPAGGCRSTHTFAQRDTDAGRLTLKRSDYQLTTVHKIEPHPVHIFQFMEQQGRQIRCISYSVALPRQQCPGLSGQAGRNISCYITQGVIPLLNTSN